MHATVLSDKKGQAWDSASDPAGVTTGRRPNFCGTAGVSAWAAVRDAGEVVVADVTATAAAVDAIRADPAHCILACDDPTKQHTAQQVQDWLTARGVPDADAASVAAGGPVTVLTACGRLDGGGSADGGFVIDGGNSSS